MSHCHPGEPIFLLEFVKFSQGTSKEEICVDFHENLVLFSAICVLLHNLHVQMSNVISHLRPSFLFINLLSLSPYPFRDATSSSEAHKLREEIPV